MANQGDVDKLLEGVDVWNQWRQDNPDVEPDLSDCVIGDAAFLANYKGIREAEDAPLDLSNINFSQVNFKQARLVNVHMHGADLSNACLQHALLEKLYCDNSNFSDADLSMAELTNPCLKNSDFQNSKLSYAKFWNADMENVNLWSANLDFAVLSGVNLHKADLESASLVHVNLEGANLSHANLWTANLHDSNLWHANCESANLSDVDFSKATLNGSVMKRANLSGASFRDADLGNVDVRYADLTRSNFVNAHVTGIRYNKHSVYRGIQTSACYGSPMFKRFAQDQDYVEEFKTMQWDPFAWLRHTHAWKWAKPIPLGLYLYWGWYVTSDCGRSLFRWSLLTVFLAIFFGVIYYQLGESSFHINSYDGVGLPWSQGTMIYYSVITFSTLGFGDIVPKNPLAVRWVIAEVITGYIMLGGLISILAGKMARRA